MTARELRTSKERTLFTICALCSGLMWLVILVVLNCYLPFVAFFAIAAHALMLARITGHAVRVGPDQLPEIWERVVRSSEALGLEKPPETWVMQAGGILNAFATKFFSRRFVVLYADLIDAVEEAGPPREGPDEVDFIVAHEIGHLAAGHLKWNTFLLPSVALPWIGAAYSRAREYTCDLCGHEVVQDLDVSSRALAMLAAGGRLSRRVDLDAFTRQRFTAGRFWNAVYELNASHPYLAKRVAALREHTAPGSAQPIPRSLGAWILAPLFGFTSPGGLAAFYIVAIVGVLAAIAIPNFVEMQYRAKRAEVPATLDQIVQAEWVHFEEHGGYLECGDESSALSVIGKTMRRVGSDVGSTCLSALGTDDTRVRGAYWVVTGLDADGDPAFEAYGVSDVDGDGEAAVYRATALETAQMLTPMTVY